MKKINDAIYTLFTTKTGGVYPALHINLGGRLYGMNAPQKATWPYGIFFPVSDVPDYLFDKTLTTSRVQFSLFSSDESSSNIETLYDNLTTLYDWCKLTLTSVTFLYMKRLNSTLLRDPNDMYWMYHIDYELMTDI